MTPASAPKRKIKILIADDHAWFRRVFKSLFHPDEAEFVESSNGCDAVMQYSEHRPDWVVMDYDMAPMDGLTATESIRSQFPNARILLITLHDVDEIRDAVRHVAATALVGKENLMKARDIIRNSGC